MDIAVDTQQQKQHSLAWVMWAIAASFYFYEFMLQVSPSVMVPELMRAFDISAQRLGDLASMYFFVYAPMQIPVGILLDRYGPRKLLILAVLSCAVSSVVFSQTQTYILALLARAFIGFGSAFAIVGAMKVISNWFLPNKFASLLGLVVMIGMFGAVSGQAPLAYSVNQVGWRHTMLGLGILGVGLAIVMFCVLRDHPNGKQTHHHTDESDSIFAGLKIIVRSKQTWLASVYGSFMFAPTLAFAALWGVPYLHEAYHYEPSLAAFSVSLIFIGWAIGSPLVGLISDNLGRRKPTMYGGSFGALLTICIILYVPHLPLFILQFLLFCFGLFSSGFLMAFPIVKELNCPKHNATAMGFINTLNTLGGALLQPLIGYILDMFWQGNKIHGIPFYSSMDFKIALTALPVIILVAIIILPFIEETYCRQQKS